MKVLNITNGDGAANIIKESDVVGDVLPWRDPMHHGPFPATLDLASVSRIRARYLAGPDGDPEPVERDFALRDQHLAAVGNYDLVVLWFEHDLLDQLQILQILDWFSASERDGPELNLICIDSFPGKPNFRGIGELDAQEMGSLPDQQQTVTRHMLTLAKAGWEAFRSPDPNDLVEFLTHDLGALPYLKGALLRHLEEYPDATSGLSQTETQILRLVSEGVQNPVGLFRQNMDLETSLYIGDWSTYRIIDDLCRGELLVCDPEAFSFPSFSISMRDSFNTQRLQITRAGQNVLDGAQDAFGFMPRRGWLGGVELCKSGAVWTWDRTRASVQRRELA